MLARSAGRRQQQKQTSRLLAASFAQLNLPWLAPAQLRWTASQTTATERQHRSRRGGNVTTLRQDRRLATAAETHHDSFSGATLPPPGFRNSLQDEHVPWDVATSERPSTLRPYMEPVIINTTIQTAHELITVQNGVNGTVSELLQHFHTSLQVGRIKRAEVIVQRLAEQCSPNSAEILYAHGAYLEEALSRLSSYGARTVQAQDALREMQKWFEFEVRNKGVTPSAKMIVSLIRAITRALPDPNREIAIRRYAALAEAVGPEVHEEVLSSEEYDDHEYTVVGRATSALWAPVSQVESKTVGRVALEPELLPQPISGGLTRANEQAQMESVPEVLATEQKGGGLSRIKTAMTALNRQAALTATATEEERRSHAYERQRVMEETSVEIAVERWREADDELRKIGIHTIMQKKPIAALMWQWYQALLPALKQELAETKAVLARSGRIIDDRYIYGPYLELMSLEKLAATTILHMLTTVCRGKNQRSDTYESESKLGNLAVSMGKSIEEEYRAESSIANSHHKATKQRKKQASKQKSKSKVKAAPKHTREAEVLSQQWPMDLRVKLGAMLVSKIIETAQLPVTRTHPRSREEITRMQPAFMHRYKWVNGKRIGAITPNPALMEKLESEPLGGMLAKRMPMLVEPQPWEGWNKGGYLHYAVPILRLPNGDTSGRDYFHAAHKNGDLGRVYAGLNALSKVPWKVHPDVLKTQIEAWNTGERIANFAPLNPQLSIPPEPEADAGVPARMQWVARVRDVENIRTGLHSKRCFQNFQLEIARSVKDEVLYFPHNMDFRGRAYPIPPYLNHMGADNVRGLLVFADGKPLGPDGLRWLKIHLATVAGHDKASLEDRVAFTMAHLDDIHDSVRSPLGGRRWWLEAEDAWQTLAACFELTEALKCDDPTKFVSHLPIQQDGTCNGLQHYAALGGDEIGARQVNLEPGDKPADVYTAVADAVREEVRKDAEKGDPIASKLHGRITRKCVKQPVMTNVYGVTFFGARAQVEKQLAVLFPEVKRSDKVDVPAMANYVALKIFKSLGDMFKGAQAIQTWLGQCAHRISTCMTPEQIQQVISLDESSTTASPPQMLRKTATLSKNRGQSKAFTSKPKNSDLKPLFKSTVVWTTPLRLPVVQPYRQASSRRIDTTIQGLTIQEPQVWDPVSKKKQLQAFPPNFIHSLDATHMLLSAAKCTETGMTFASIHDSFWTHACHVDGMSNVLRDAFVEMHSENIIERLREEFLLRYKDCMYLASLDVKSPAVRTQIKKCRFKTSHGVVRRSELGQEVERLRLLKSEDPEEREKGKAMVTPASIIAQSGEDGYMSNVATDDAPLRTGLGEMPSIVSDKLDAGASDADVAFAEADAEAVMDGETAAEDETYASSMDESELETNMPSETSKKRPTQMKVSVWLPVTFPEIPEKGTFDVTRLRASKYFFH